MCEKVDEEDAVAPGRAGLDRARPADAPGRRRHPALRQRRRHRADRRARRPPRSSSATATSPCTRRRPAARGGSPSSTSRPVPRPATSCAWSPTCATPSSAARSRCSTSRSSSTVDGRAGRRRVAGPLGAPRARPDQPGDVRPAGRGERPDRRRSACSCSTRPAASWPSGTTCSATPRRRGPTSTSRRCSSTTTCPARSPRRCERHGLDAVADLDRDHRVGPDEGPGVGPRGARSSCATSASSWRSTTSAPATRRWPTCGTCRSTA